MRESFGKKNKWCVDLVCGLSTQTYSMCVRACGLYVCISLTDCVDEYMYSGQEFGFPPTKLLSVHVYLCTTTTGMTMK